MAGKISLSFTCQSTANSSWDELAALWRAADQIPVFESAWTSDHFYDWSDAASGGGCWESWTAVAALLAQTTRLRGGVLVSGNPYRHPGVVAKMAATIDNLSGGRLELGLGAGWLEEEAQAYGIDLLPPGQRFDRFEEAIQIVLSLLTNDTTSFAGDYYHLTDARCEPKPVQRPHPPLCIGGGGVKRSIPAAARWAQHWNLGVGSPRAFASKRELLLDLVRENGRDPGAMRCSTQVSWLRADTGAFADAMVSYVEGGADHLVVVLPEPLTPHDLDDIVVAGEKAGLW